MITVTVELIVFRKYEAHMDQTVEVDNHRLAETP